MAKLEKRAWWPDLLRLKDDYSLRELSRRFDVSPAAIQVALKRNGITRRKSRAGRPVGVGSQTGIEFVVKPRGRHSRRYSEMRLAPFEGQLGRLADKVLAEKAGLSPATVARIRRSRGIDAPGQRRKGAFSRSKVAIYEDLLGRVPDAEVAHLAGVSRAAVRNYRVRRGVASPSLQGGESALKNGSSSMPAWLVQCSGDRCVVVLAQTVSEVVEKIGKMGLDPHSVERLPPLL